MAKIFFSLNRKKVQNYFAAEEFIIPIISDTLNIEESKADANKQELRYLRINNVPFNNLHHISWKIDLEKEGYIFSSPPSKKKCDSALLIIINNRLYVFMIEMKTSITNNGSTSSLEAIEQKFIDTMERISLLLTVNVHENVQNSNNELVFKNTQIEYRGIIVYNNDNVPVLDDELRKSDLYKILKGDAISKRIHPTSLLLGNAARINIQFYQNNDLINNPTKITVAFNQFFQKEIKFLGPNC